MVTLSPAARRGDAVRVKFSGSEVQHLSRLKTIPGVAILAAAGRNGSGVGRLRSSPSNASALEWKAPGSSSWGTPVDVSAGGSHLLEDGADPGKWLRVTAFPSFLVGAGEESEVYLGDRVNAIGGDEVSAAEASAGLVESHALELVNESPMTVLNLNAWLDPTTSGLEISDDDATWVSPTVEGSALALSSALAPAASVSLFVRRTVGAGASAAPGVLSLIQLSWKGN